MHIRQFAQRLGVSERMVRHYERSGLLSPDRLENGYRVFSETDVLKAERIRDMITAGFSTRELRNFADCLDEAAVTAGTHPVQCVGRLEAKLQQIEATMAELALRRQTVVERLATARARLETDAAAE